MEKRENLGENVCCRGGGGTIVELHVSFLSPYPVTVAIRQKEKSPAHNEEDFV